MNYRNKGKQMNKKEIEVEIEAAFKKVKDGDAVFYSADEAKTIMEKNKAAARKRFKKTPLPVGLTKAQHEYLESQGVGKAEYMRNLLVIDMEKKNERTN